MRKGTISPAIARMSARSTPDQEQRWRVQEVLPCSGVLLNLDGSEQGPVIVQESGREFYFLRTNPSTLMLVGTGTKVSHGQFPDRREHDDTAGGTATRPWR
jgi:hypothetical protein